MDGVKRYTYEVDDGVFAECVLGEDFDAALAREAALREELAKANKSADTYLAAWEKCAEFRDAAEAALVVAKRNEHNSEVAYKAAIEKQEELRDRKNSIVDLQQRLTAAEQRNAVYSSLLRRSADLLRGAGFYMTAGEIDAALKPTESGASE